MARHYQEIRWKNHRKSKRKIELDSGSEQGYLEELQEKKQRGEIKEIFRQFKLSLCVGDDWICDYWIDFKIIHNDDQVEFIEVKGMEKEIWRFKWKLFLVLADTIEPGCIITLIRPVFFNPYKIKK